MELAFAQRFHRLLAVDIIVAAVPNHHRPAAVLPLWDYPLERGVLDRMILHLDGEVFFALHPGQTFRNGPRF